MDILNETELSQLLGGGYWWKDTNGDWHYSPDDEIPDGDDIIWEQFLSRNNKCLRKSIVYNSIHLLFAATPLY